MNRYPRLTAADRAKLPTRHLRERSHTPTLYRDTSTTHDPSVGGLWYDVTYVGDSIGQIVSTWSMRDGVHWIIKRNGTIADPADPERPRVFTSRVDAINALLEAAGWRGDYDPGTGHKPFATPLHHR